MTEKSYQDAVQVLRSHMNSRWVGLEDEGRDEMVEVLKDELGYDDDQANDTIDALAASGILRYHRPGADLGDVVPVPLSPGGVAGTATGGYATAPFVQGEPAGSGYWQIGPQDEDTPGRLGQV